MNQINRDANNPEVVISGLGPTGLVLAHMLGMRGHHVVVLEREPVFYGNARAVYTDDECMRIFQHIGVANEVAEKMQIDTPVQFVRNDGTVVGRYVPRKRPNGWPVNNFFYQPYLETTVADLLERYPNVEIRRGRELIAFSQEGERVEITHRATRSYRFGDLTDARVEREGEDDLQTLTARYLVGADGGRSAVRELLGIKMTGKSFPEPWLVVDLKLKEGADALHHIPYFSFVVDPYLPTVSCVQPDGYHRFEFMLMPGVSKEWMEQPSTVREHISRWVDPDQFEVKRRLVYTFNALMAEKWREGRVLLAGDSAHMTPQFMGQGASSGFRDAYNLGWKLSVVLKGTAGPALLDSYEQERRGHAQAMVDTSVWLKGVVSMTNPFGTFVRDTLFALARHFGPMRRYLEEGHFKPGPSYQPGRFLGLSRRSRKGPEGTLAPQPNIRTIDGRSALLDSVLGDGFSLVGLNQDPREGLSAAMRLRLASLRSSCVALYPYGGRPQGLEGVARATPQGLTEVEDLDGAMIAWFKRAGFTRRGIAILRPDKFVFAVVEPKALGAALEALAAQLHQHAVALEESHA